MATPLLQHHAPASQDAALLASACLVQDLVAATSGQLASVVADLRYERAPMQTQATGQDASSPSVSSDVAIDAGAPSSNNAQSATPRVQLQASTQDVPSGAAPLNAAVDVAEGQTASVQ